MERPTSPVHPNERLRQERLQRNWRQRDVADKLETTIVTINRWERGTQQPSAYFRVKLCALFGKSEEELGISPEEVPPPFLEEIEEEVATKTVSLQLPDAPASTITPLSVQMAPQIVHLTSQQQQNHTRMLRRLHHSYRTLLTQSLQGVTKIDLELSQRSDAVRNMTTLMLRSEKQPEHLLPPETSIMQAYEDAEHELLILGEPGTGKSMLLLYLAQQLVTYAETDSTLPLPIMLPLSSWAVKRLPLEDWIAEQLTQLYDVPLHLAQEWIQEGHILPLLDGLDEMETSARPACIAAINAYHRMYLAPLVVCSRTNEYSLAAEQHRLILHQAVVVQPLTVQQVKSYLETAGQPFAALRQTLKENLALQELVTTPLMLNIVLLAYRETSIHSLPTASDQLQQQVWTDYIERMVARKGDAKRYPLQQTQAWLTWLARQMRIHSQTVFYLELLQPDWLADGYQRAYTWLGIRLSSLFIGAVVSVFHFLLFFHTSDRRDIVLFGVVGGLLGALLSIAIVDEDTPHNKQQRPRWQTQLALSCLVGAIISVSEGWGLDTTASLWMTDGLVLGLVFTLSSFLLQQVLFTPAHHITLVSRVMPKRWINLTRVLQRWHPLQTAWTVLLFGISCAIYLSLSSRLPVELSYTLSEGLTEGLSIGLTSMVIRTILERHGRGIYLTERLTWTWQSLRDGLFAFTHIRLSLILVGCILIFITLSYGLSYGLSDGLALGLRYGFSEGISDSLSTGLGYWLLVGLYHSIAQEQMENQDRRVANQGIRRSVHNSILIGLIGGAIVGATLMLSYGLRDGLYYGLLDGMQDGFYYGMSIGLHNGVRVLLPSLAIVSILYVGMVSGGLAAWRHYVIRSLLARMRFLPWKTSQFLDDATARILLRHVGGGYSFTHRLLLDHFADSVDTGIPPQ